MGAGLGPSQEAVGVLAGLVMSGGEPDMACGVSWAVLPVDHRLDGATHLQHALDVLYGALGHGGPLGVRAPFSRGGVGRTRRKRTEMLL